MTSTTLSNSQKMFIMAAITTTSFCPSQYSSEFAQASACRIEPIASFALKTDRPLAVSHATAQEMIANLRKGGMPVSAIAEAMQVERKTIYAWLSGGDIRNANVHRAAQVHALLTGVSGVDVRGVYRFWNTRLVGNTMLRDLMTAENINESLARSVLDNLRPAALRSMVREKKMARQGATNALLDDIPEAGVGG